MSLRINSYECFYTQCCFMGIPLRRTHHVHLLLLCQFCMVVILTYTPLPPGLEIQYFENHWRSHGCCQPECRSLATDQGAEPGGNNPLSCLGGTHQTFQGRSLSYCILYLAFPSPCTMRTRK